MTTTDRLYAFLRHLAETNRPLPVMSSICDALRISDKVRQAAFKTLATEGRIRLQKKMGATTEARRVVFPDGLMTPWTVPPKDRLAPYRAGTSPLNHDRRLPVSADDQRMIAEVVQAGRVTRCPPAGLRHVDDYYRRISI